MMRKNKLLLIFLIAALLVVGLLNKFYFKKESQLTKPSSAQINMNCAAPQAKDSIPQKVYTVLKYVEVNHKPMKGYVGGREFKNREKLLPFTTKENKKIYYQEWDVNPKKEGQNRGAERLVTGNDSTAWYTNNHYKSFTKIK